MQLRSEPVIAYIGLGSNLDDPQLQVQRALIELDELDESRCENASGLYRSAPMGPQDQPDYINAVAALRTRLQPHDLLHGLLAIEKAHGRERDPGLHWGPRPLDLDILMYGDEQIDEDGLAVPHAGLHERVFVLYPLYEIAPDLVVPGRGPLQALLAACPRAGLERLKLRVTDVN